MSSELPEQPRGQINHYLARLAGQNVNLPTRPNGQTNAYLDYIVNNGVATGAGTPGSSNANYRGANLSETNVLAGPEDAGRRRGGKRRGAGNVHPRMAATRCF